MTYDGTQETIPPRALNERDAATYIGMSTAFLRQSRCYGNRKGHTPAPSFIRAGRTILYLVQDLDAWLMSHRVELASGDD